MRADMGRYVTCTIAGAMSILQLTARSDEHLDVVWGAPQNDGGAQVVGYRVEVRRVRVGV